MRKSWFVMGMPVVVEANGANEKILEEVLAWFKHVDQTFSPFKNESEISRFNRKEITQENLSEEVNQVLKLCEKTKEETRGYFNIEREGKIDPSGMVKGWAIWKACEILEKRKIKDFFVEAGGDVQVKGKNKEGKGWKIGVRNPFNKRQIVKVIALENGAVVTSGTYEKGTHIYNPKTGKAADEIVSLTVVGPSIFDADRFATAAFAMGKKGINFIEKLPGFEAYTIDKNKIATFTSGFESYTLKKENENN